jgi:SAM-dependent methyltransferase
VIDHRDAGRATRADGAKRAVGVDWDLGSYEFVAAQLLPAARAVIDDLDPQPGERVVDVGCGTGNASLLAAARGARVLGIDPSPRLLEVARRAAESQAADVEFLAGDGACIPVPDRSVDAVVSVFGVIFAPDAPACAAEISRALGPLGRIALAAWTPDGPIAEQAGVRRDAVESVTGSSAGPRPFPWHDPSALRSLLGPFGFEVETHRTDLVFTAGSAHEYAEGEFGNHPLWVEARTLLEPLGTWPAVREAAEGILTEANEVDDGFRLRSRYTIATARRGPPAP